MATIAVQNIINTGLDPVFAAASAGGDKAITGPGAYLEVKNGGGSAVTVTLATPGTVDGDLAVADRTVSVPAGGSRKVALPHLYRNPSDGLAAISYSAVTSVTVAVFRAPVTA